MSRIEIIAGQGCEYRSQPMFSVVTVCLNAGGGLVDTVRSVLEQTFEDFEIIVKDGGSNDGSLARLPQSPKLKIVAGGDAGIYDAMNQGLTYCHGQYILFLNAGDTFYAADVLAQLAPFCDQDEVPDLIYCDYAVDGGKARVRSPSNITRFFLYRTMLCHQACFVRRDCHRDLGNFNTQLRINADYDFLLRLMLRPQARSLYVPIVATTFLGGGVSSDPAMFSLMRCEVMGLRKKYFPGWEGLAFGLFYACTLPRLRNGILRSPKIRFLAILYRYGVNTLYILSAWRKRGHAEKCRQISRSKSLGRK